MKSTHHLSFSTMKWTTIIDCSTSAICFAIMLQQTELNSFNNLAALFGELLLAGTVIYSALGKWIALLHAVQSVVITFNCLANRFSMGMALIVAVHMIALCVNHLATASSNFQQCMDYAVRIALSAANVGQKILKSTKHAFDYQQMKDRLYFNPHQPYFVFMACVRMAWLPLLVTTMALFGFEMVSFYRSYLLIKITNTFGQSPSEHNDSFWVLMLIWIATFLEIPGSSYMYNLTKKIADSIGKVLEIRFIEMYLAVNCNNSQDIGNLHMVVNKLPSFKGNFVKVMYKIRSLFKNMISFYIISATIGWLSAIPIVVSLLSIANRKVILKALDKMIYNFSEDKTTRFQTKASTLLNNMRAIKQYCWESKLLKSVFSPEAKDQTPVHLKLAAGFLMRVNKYIVDIAIIITFAWHFQRHQSMCYTEMSVLVMHIRKIVTFVANISNGFEQLEQLNLLDPKVRIMLDCQKTVYTTKCQSSNVSDYAIKLDNSVFSWGKDKFLLGPLTIGVRKGEFVTVIGKVGCGKSSFLSAVCGEMPLISGSASIYGTIGYVSQKPWIMNATFRDNILLGNAFDSEKYFKTIKACALEEDIAQLPVGDKSEIGHKGINLSGGQKARLALARAIFNNADVYILDDILSAVDAQVERHIIEHVLTGSGIIAQKTRILVTHAQHVVPLSDRVLSMSDGRIDMSEQTPIQFADNLCLSSNLTDIKEITKTNDFQPVETLESGKFNVAPEIDVPQFDWNMLLKFLKLSGYSTVLLAILLIVFSNTISYYKHAKAGNVLNYSGKYISSKHILQYLIYNTCAKIILSELETLIIKLRKNIWGVRAMNYMRISLLNRLAYSPLALFERLSTYSLTELYGREIKINVDKIVIGMCCIFGYLFGSSINIIAMYLAAPYMVLFVVPYAYLNYKVSCQHTNLLKKKQAAVNNQKTQTAITKQELLAGHEVIRIHNMANILVNIYEENSRNASDLIDSHHVKSEILLDLWHNTPLLINVSIFLYYKWISSSTDIALSPGIIITSSKWCTSAANSIRFLIVQRELFYKHLPWLAKYFMYAEQLEQEAAHIIDSYTPDPCWPANGVIEFKNYSMQYRPDLDMVLSNLTFATVQHEKVGIVGRTGAGKSSLTQALLRLVEPASSSIIIDNVDISTIGLFDLRSRISMVPQDPMLLQGTIRDNLDPFNEYSDEEVWSAINKACISDLLKQNNNERSTNNLKLSCTDGFGLNTWVEADGQNFSVGQRQLVSLCRALLWNRNIVILDEATANIDAKTDQLMQKIIRTEFKQCTVLTIAHRLNTIMDSDRIMVLDHGRIVEFDAPQKLLAQPDSQFSKMVESMKFNEQTIQE